MKSRLVLVGRIGASHGIKGEVRLQSFTADPLSVRDYSPLSAEDGRSFEIEAARPAAGTSPDMLVVRIKGIHDRNAAEALKGTELFVSRDRLPEPEADEFYHADLIGLSAVTRAGEELGTVVAVVNHGAGDILEIAPPRGETLLVPFSRKIVPEVDLAGKRIVVDPPPGLLESEEQE